MIDLGYSLEADDTMAVRLHCSKMSRVKRRRKKKKGKTKTVDRVVIVRLGSGSGGSPLSMQRWKSSRSIRYAECKIRPTRPFRRGP